VFACSGCGRCGASDDAEQGAAPADSASAAVTPSAVAPPEDPELASARAMLERFLAPGANRQALSGELIPHEEDYDAVFLPEVADRAHGIYAPRFDRSELVIEPAPEHQGVEIYRATTEELRMQQGQSNRFPGGYKGVAEQLQPGLTFYTFAFVSEGDHPQLVYDGLVRVNDRWVIFPKLWQALRAGGPPGAQ
jgi:hypothetical protein